MIPGPDQLVACPHCGKLAKHMTLTSGNTIGARVWTDGKQIAPMLPRPPAVVKCGHCTECYWLADARKVGTVTPWGDEDRQVDPAWAAAPEVREPAEDEYYHAIQKGLAVDSKQERALRILAWWRRNDAFRDSDRVVTATTEALSETCRENLVALATLLDEEDENDRIMKAEVFRELGQFESAKAILSQVRSSEYDAIVHQLRRLCDAGDAAVRESHFGD